MLVLFEFLVPWIIPGLHISPLFPRRTLRIPVAAAGTYLYLVMAVDTQFAYTNASGTEEVLLFVYIYI